MQETWIWSLDWEDPQEKELATHSSILAWEIEWTEAPGRLSAHAGWLADGAGSSAPLYSPKCSVSLWVFLKNLGSAEALEFQQVPQILGATPEPPGLSPGK